MQTLQELRQDERAHKAWSGTDYVEVLKNESFGRSSTEVLGLESRNFAPSHTLELMKPLGDGYPIIVIDGKPFDVCVDSFRGRDGFDRLLDHDDLYDLLMHSAQRVGLASEHKAYDQPFNPLHAEGDGAGIVFGPSFEARVREASSQGGATYQ